MNGVSDLPKIHGTFFSVIFTSTTPSVHGLPLRPESAGFDCPEKLAWLSPKVLRAAGTLEKTLWSLPA